MEVKIQLYTLISRAVDEGVAFGLRRAYKHTDTPTQDQLEDHITRGVMNALHEVIDFEEAKVEAPSVPGQPSSSN